MFIKKKYEERLKKEVKSFKLKNIHFYFSIEIQKKKEIKK